MPLTPLDINQKVFSKSFRGYSEDEVNEFLEQVMNFKKILDLNLKSYLWGCQAITN